MVLLVFKMVNHTLFFNHLLGSETTPVSRLIQLAIRETFGRASKGISINHVTLEEYLGYMEQAFLVYRAERMDSKTKEYLSTSDKFYASDTGIRNSIIPYRPEDLDGLLENIVYNELRFRYGEVATYAVGDREIDFIADPRGNPSYYQVSMNISNPKTLEREIRPLKEIDDNYPRYLITYDRYLLNDIDGIKVVQIIDWLLGQ